MGIRYHRTIRAAAVAVVLLAATGCGNGEQDADATAAPTGTQQQEPTTAPEDETDAADPTASSEQPTAEVKEPTATLEQPAAELEEQAAEVDDDLPQLPVATAATPVPTIDAAAVLAAGWSHSCLAGPGGETEPVGLEIMDDVAVASQEDAHLQVVMAPIAQGDATGDGVEELLFVVSCHLEMARPYSSIEVWTSGEDGPVQLPTLISFDRYMGDLDEVWVHDDAAMTTWSQPPGLTEAVWLGTYRHTWTDDGWAQQQVDTSADDAPQQTGDDLGAAAGDGPIDDAWLDGAATDVACDGQRQVQLRDGAAEVDDITVRRAPGAAFGDLTGDGNDEAAMIVHCVRNGNPFSAQVVVFDHRGSQLPTDIQLVDDAFAAWPLNILPVGGGVVPAGYGAVEVGIADPWDGYPFSPPPADHFEHASSYFYFRDGVQSQAPAGVG